MGTPATGGFEWAFKHAALKQWQLGRVSSSRPKHLHRKRNRSIQDTIAVPVAQKFATATAAGGRTS